MGDQKNSWDQYNIVQKFMSKVVLWTVLTMIVGWVLSQAIGGYGYLIGFFIAWYVTHKAIAAMKANVKQ
jgi:cbb3-type cytochrome oxidase subunit 1